MACGQSTCVSLSEKIREAPNYELILALSFSTRLLNTYSVYTTVPSEGKKPLYLQAFSPIYKLAPAHGSLPLTLSHRLWHTFGTTMDNYSDFCHHRLFLPGLKTSWECNYTVYMLLCPWFLVRPIYVVECSRNSLSLLSSIPYECIIAYVSILLLVVI